MKLYTVVAGLNSCILPEGVHEETLLYTT